MTRLKLIWIRLSAIIELLLSLPIHLKPEREHAYHHDIGEEQ